MRVAITTDIEPGNGTSIEWCLNTLFAMNVGILVARKRKKIHTPLLYDSGVVYQPEPWIGTIESFDTIPVVLARKWGDCDDLAAWRAAELFVLGIKAHPIVVETPTSRAGNRRWHCLVHHVSKGVEDPSVKLGMKVL
jgi:hypothetical protein